MREWYDGYRFAKTAPNVVYNTDVVLYYLQQSVPNEPGPDNLINDNVRIDYGRLAQRNPKAEFKGLALVFCGWELAHAADASAGGATR